MKIILTQDVVNLGEEGDICTVADGYARNFLIPKRFAVLHTSANETNLKQKQRAIEERKETKRKEALSLAEKLKDENVTFTVSVNERGQLFGAITATQIAEELAKKGFSVDRRKITIPSHTLKAVGNYEVNIHLYQGADVSLIVNVEPDKKPEVREEIPAKTEEIETEEAVSSDSTSAE